MAAVVVESAYQPNRASAAILNRALMYVRSVPYKVTARWLFYRLLQDGTYRAKSDYKNKFLGLLTRARKAFWNGWAPDTLADDTREALYRGFGYTSARAWIEKDIYSQGCNLDKWQHQPAYVEVWFEAAAMRSQFEYYTEHVSLRPFQGDPSLDFKWETAKHLEVVAKSYPGKPLVVLYFGDLDPKGLQIPDSARADVQSWCSATFEYVRCGLNPGDERRFNLAENIDKPGTYQWEALGDTEAQTVIRTHLERYINPAAFRTVEDQEKRDTLSFQAAITSILTEWP